MAKTYLAGDQLNIAGAMPGQLQRAEFMSYDDTGRTATIRYVDSRVVVHVALNRLRRLP